MTVTVAAINLAHFHLGDLMRFTERTARTELVALCDEDPEIATLDLDATAAEFGLDSTQTFQDHEHCLETVDPDIVITCPVPADHADWVENLLAYDVDVILEKPLAATLEDADRIIAATEKTDNRLLVNWPLAWNAAHRTTKRLIDEDTIGTVQQVHYYGGNRGVHRFTRAEYGANGTNFVGSVSDTEPIPNSWFDDPHAGGGSLLDYLGYGVTLGTWFRDGDLPIEVTTNTHAREWSDVDEQSVTIARYDTGLSKYETSWRTFTDPWETQPQPRCGFTIVGTSGTIASHDYRDHVHVQTETEPAGIDVLVDDLEPPLQNPIQYLAHCIEAGSQVEFGPVSLSINRKGQQIIEAARRSAERGETVPVPE